MLIPAEPPRLYLSHDTDYGWLIAVEHGRVGEDQPQGCWVVQGTDFAYLLDAPEGRVVGFRVNDVAAFDPDDPEVAAIWDEPRFDAPVLGLSDVTAGEIVVGARRRFGDRDSLNRTIFKVATKHEGEEALQHWNACLEAGDGMAHCALGYTLLDLGRAQEAYGHLRHYTEIAPMGPWNWCWYGQAAEATGELDEARRAYRRAVELEEVDEDGAAGTDAAERLAALEAGLAEDEEALAGGPDATGRPAAPGAGRGEDGRALDGGTDEHDGPTAGRRSGAVPAATPDDGPLVCDELGAGVPVDRPEGVAPLGRFDDHGPAAAPVTPVDRVRGGLLGLAIGDALGAGIEHASLARIRRRFGHGGLTDPVRAYGRVGAITDETQMALFGAEALLRTVTRAAERGVPGDAVWQFDQAWARWLETQGERSARWDEAGGERSPVTRALRAGGRRGPGRTCIAAMGGAVAGSPEQPTNTSKGCGAVGRVAPIGLALDDAQEALDLARRTAALTHGHPTAGAAAGAFAAILAHVRRGMDVASAVVVAMEHDLTGVPGREETIDALLLARRLAAGELRPSPETVALLGQGWLAHEALAIAVYCAHVAETFEHGVLLAVNHGGDSDSTGAICGAILGTRWGADAIPPRWLDRLEHRDLIDGIAEDLHAAFGTPMTADVLGDRWQGRWPAE